MPYMNENSGPSGSFAANDASLSTLNPAPPPFARRLRLLKWITIVVPGVVIFALEVTRHGLIEPFVDAHVDQSRIPGISTVDIGNLAVGLIAMGLAFIFSHLVFRVIEHMQGTLVRRNAELAALNTVATTAGASLKREEIVADVYNALQRLFAADAVQIDVTVPGDPAPDNELRTTVRDGQATIHVPLQCRGRVHGTLSLVRTGRGFSRAEHRLLQSIGDTLGMAIENARLHQQAYQAAIVEERGRIAREMHDGVAQILAFVMMKLGTVDGLIASGATAEARRELESLHRAAESAYTDVREQILGLRLVAENDKDLIGWLRTYLDDFGEQTGLDVDLAFEPIPDEVLPRQHQLQVIRIVQEALTNVRKHAEARRVRVYGTHGGGELVLTVEDDGRGFQDTDRQPGGHFGLLTMRERAESLGGNVEIHSEPGAGTRVTLRVPLTTGDGTVPRLGQKHAADLIATR